MLRDRFLLTSLVLLFILVVTGYMNADPLMFTLWELTEKSDVVFTGQVSEVGRDSAIIKIKEILTGKLDSNTAVVTPITIEEDFGGPVNFKNSENVLIYGNKDNSGQVVITAGGHGKIILDPKNVDIETAAAKRILEIASLKEENTKNLAMITLAKSSNKRLRSESQSYIAIKISSSKLRDNYKKELIELINDTDPEIQRTGLQGIQYVKAKEAFSRIVELTHSENLNVVSSASQAIAHYENPDSERVLIELTKHKEGQIRIRAIIDLSFGRLPESKVALSQLLYDKDPKVRAMAPRGLVRWLRANQANDVLPRLEEMLNDPSAEVRIETAQNLGESRNSSVVKYLIEALKKYPNDANMKRFILQSLGQHSRREKGVTIELIDEVIDLVIDALKNGGPTDSFGPAFEAVGILSLSNKPEAIEALRWAAESHPNVTVKSIAARSIEKIKD